MPAKTVMILSRFCTELTGRGAGPLPQRCGASSGGAVALSGAAGCGWIRPIPQAPPL